MNRCCKRGLTVLLFLLNMLPQLIHAQQIKGTITDENEPLPGVVVMIRELNSGAVTDLDGNFLLNVRNTGKYVVEISYVGYQSKQITVDLTESEYNIGRIRLQQDTQQLGEVVITGAMGPSQMKAYNIKKNAPALVDVIAADAIGKLPDRNAAEAIQRIKGVAIERDLGEGRYASVRGTPMQWSSTLLNGNRLPSASGDYSDRRVQMDIFPSELIEFVQLSKAITPDMEGDAIGGSINFITKTAPLSRLLSLNMAGGYGDQSRDGSYNGSIVYGDRLLNGKLGFVVSGMIWERGAANDRYNLEYNYSLEDPVQSFSINELQLRDYITRRRTTGFNGGLEYLFNDRHKLFAKGIYSEYLDNQNVRETYFNFDGNYAQVQTRGTDYNIRLHSVELGGVHTLNSKLELDWNASTDKSSFRFKGIGYPIATFQQSVQYEGLSSDGYKYLEMDSPNGVGDKIDHILPHLSPGTPISAENMRLLRMIVTNNTNSEQNYRAAANLKYDVSQDLKLKFGGKFIQKQKDVATPLDIYMPKMYLGMSQELPPSIKDLGTEPFPYNGGFLSEIGSPYDNVLIDQMRVKDVAGMLSKENMEKYDLLNVSSTSPDGSGASNYYHGKEKVYALYAMGEYKINNLTLIGGFRNEYNEVRFYGKDETDASGIRDVIQDNSYNAFLPMLHVKYNFTQNTILRAAYTRTFARADFSDLNPAVTINETFRTITYGNGKLKPTFSNNFDLAFEHYFGVLGLIDGSLFYKKLSDIIYTNQSSTQLNGMTYTTLEPGNLEGGWLMGFELGVSKRFTELPSIWKGFGVEGNYTFTNSETKVPRWVNDEKVIDKTVIPKQSKHLFNVALLYEYNRLSARLAGNYKGKYLDSIRQEAGTGHYRWYESNFTVDFSGSYAITPKIRFFIELNNLTNAPVRFSHGTYDRPEQAEWYSFRGQAGISIKLY
ncbi:MAG: TonB-dependent receptor [Tannerellaceae bacterium]|nr:TonB-dependent receptor [Tannerellaceae bacterium]